MFKDVPMVGKFSPKNLGNISLCVAGGGFIVLVLILHFRLVEGTAAQLLIILTAAFEAGTAGALADWFAVRALFQKIPIPLMERHTNIIVESRQRLTNVIAKVTTTHLLTKESIGEMFKDVQFSSRIMDLLKRLDGKDKGLWFRIKLGALKYIGKGVLVDATIQQKIDDAGKEYLKDFIHNNPDKIENKVRENIEKLTDDELVELIEDNVGDELQYIRLNGAIVGGFAGLVFGIIRAFII